MNLKSILSGIIIIFCSYGVSAQKANNPSYIYAFGDMPYADNQLEKYDKLVKHINITNPDFSIHVGDTKSGSSDCSDDFYKKSLAHFNQFNQPLIYIPGDNEWTDCDRESCGGYDAEERLNYLRKTMFINPNESFGKNKIKVTSQSTMAPYEKYVENAMWKQKEILFSTIHICGSSNNFQEEGDNQEFLEREAADLHWLRTIFKKAAKEKAKGIVIAFHANIFNNQDDDGYRKILAEMKQLIFDFKKPVLAIYGDTHTYVISQPLRYNGHVLTNFTALQVFGSPDIHLVKINMDLKNDKIFDFEPVYFE